MRSCKSLLEGYCQIGLYSISIHCRLYSAVLKKNEECFLLTYTSIAGKTGEMRAGVDRIAGRR
jgi:hypothetical protein